MAVDGRHLKLTLEVASLGHAMVAFVNGEFVGKAKISQNFNHYLISIITDFQLLCGYDLFTGAAHGSHDNKSFVLKAPVELKPGSNSVTLLGSLMGLPVRKIITLSLCLKPISSERS